MMMNDGDTFEFNGQQITARTSLGMLGLGTPCSLCIGSKSLQCEQLPNCMQVIFLDAKGLEQYTAIIVAAKLEE